MGILTDDMMRVVAEQRLGFVATVCPDGTPNPSPKGTTRAWNDPVFIPVGAPSVGRGDPGANPVVLVKVTRAAPLILPAYDGGATEDEVGGGRQRYWETLWKSRRVRL